MMTTFSAIEQAQIDNMVDRILSGEMDRDCFVRTTDRLAAQYRSNATSNRLHDLTAREIVEMRTKPTIQPTVTKRVGEYDRITKDYAAYVSIDGGPEEYIGSRKTQGAADRLCDEYAFDFYADSYTPEKAAQIAAAAFEPENDACWSCSDPEIDHPFRSLRDMVYVECPCGCGSKEICASQAAHVKALEDAIPF